MTFCEAQKENDIGQQSSNFFVTVFVWLRYLQMTFKQFKQKSQA